MKTRSALLLGTLLLAVAPTLAVGAEKSIGDRLADAARTLFARPAPGSVQLTQLLDEASSWPRAELPDDDWLDLHLLILEVRRRLDPEPTRVAPAALPPPPQLPEPGEILERARATELLDLASDLPVYTSPPGLRATPAELANSCARAATRATALAERAGALARGSTDLLVRTSAEVLAERARDLAFDLRMVAESRLPCGRERFAWLLANRHRLSATPKEAVRIGWEEFARTESEMAEVAAGVEPGATWADLTERFRADSAADAEGLLAICREITRDAEEAVAASGLISVPPAARPCRVEMIAAPFPAPYAHYRPGRTEKDGRYGGFAAYTPIPDGLAGEELRTRLRERDRHFLRAVCPHEGIPGHHLQFTVASSVKRPLRGLGYNSSYVEGWGLYSEDLMERLGFYDSPADRLAFLRLRLWRAARVVIDVGLHTGELRPSEAVHILTDRVLLSRFAAEQEVARYLRMPTQPLSYLLGMRRIRAIRRAWTARHGPDSERAFHDRFLGLAPVPLDLAAAVLLQKREAYDRAHP